MAKNKTIIKFDFIKFERKKESSTWLQARCCLKGRRRRGYWLLPPARCRTGSKGRRIDGQPSTEYFQLYPKHGNHQQDASNHILNMGINRMLPTTYIQNIGNHQQDTSNYILNMGNHQQNTSNHILNMGNHQQDASNYTYPKHRQPSTGYFQLYPKQGQPSTGYF